MVVAAHHLAAEAGAQILRDGGNAMDAAIAANAVMAVVYPQACGLGGDLFCQVWLGGERRPHGYNGSGRAPRAASSARLREMGHERMPVHGALSVTVPGAVEAWEVLTGTYGSMPLAHLLAPAITIARGGFPVSSGLHQSIAIFEGMFRADPGGHHFLPGDAVPQAGEMFRRPLLADLLERIARGGAREFYQGEVAQWIAGSVQRRGGLMTADDLQQHRGNDLDPVPGSFRDLTIWELPASTQGEVALRLLAALDRVPCRETAAWSSAALSEFGLAALDAYRWRDASVGGDTTYLCAADRDGNLVSLIQSNYMGFGSGVVVEELGLNLQNRGASFTLEDGHVNALRGGVRPRHTLIPAFASRAERPALVFGSMGGDGQPQIHANLLVRHIDEGLQPQAAVSAPRLILGLPAAMDAAYEPGFPQHGLEALRDLGFQPIAAPAPSGHFGHAQMIAITREGYTGGADPRADSAAVAE
jgi:gamma-glutamyltranspeptidase/glutathione hydrolase